jgi:hypothetical protein
MRVSTMDRAVPIMKGFLPGAENILKINPIAKDERDTGANKVALPNKHMSNRQTECVLLLLNLQITLLKSKEGLSIGQ